MTAIRDLEHLEEFLGEHGLTLVVLTQPSHCVPCRQLKPHLAKLEDKGYDVAVVDLDDVPDAVKAFNVTGVPRLLIYQDGQATSEAKGRTVVQLERDLNA